MPLTFRLKKKEFFPALEPGIERAVLFLYSNGYDPYMSGDGGEGSIFPEPTIRFTGEYKQLMSAAALLLQAQFPLKGARREYRAFAGELQGPHNEVTLIKQE